MSTRNTHIFVPNPNIVPRKIHDSYFLIDISDTYANDRCALYEINQTGMFIWGCIDGVCTEKEMVSLLKDAIVEPVDEKVIWEDVVDFLKALKERRFIEVQNHG